MDDLYQILGLTKDCSAEDIKQQFRTLARQHHPDMGGDEELFKKINYAYEILSDPVRRKDYDDTGNTQRPIDINHEAIVNLSGLFFSIIPNFDPNTGNIIDIIKQEIVKTQQAIERDKINCNVYITKLELTKGKIRKKTEYTENIFYSFADNQLQARHNDLKIMDRKLEIAREMLQILDDYMYGFIELPIPPVSGGGFMHGGD